MSAPELDRRSAGRDGLRLALVNSRFEGVVRAMMNTLLRTARSAVLNVARDFSCCILTADDELLAVAESVPIHVFRGPDLMAHAMRRFHPEFKRGDAFLHNDPYNGNSHAADYSILVPVVDDEGVHRFTVLAKAHLADCGNSVPTTYAVAARDVYEEGALIFPCVKVQEDYSDVDDVVRMCRARIRVPDLWHGDFLAILGAARIGERRLLELLDDVGADSLETYAREWFDYSEGRMVAALSRMPAGATVVSGRHDPIPGAPDGVDVNVSVAIDPKAARVRVDLRDNIDCLPCGLNLSEATATTAAMVGIFSALDDAVPTNAGSFRRVEVLLRENCIVGIPRHPYSCSVATTNLAEQVAKCVAMGIAELGDGYGMAEVGKVLPPSLGVISGVDPRHGGEPFVNMLMLATTNGAGAPQADGWLTLVGIGAGGAMLRDSVEIDELKYPICVREERIIPDSEGAGRFRGAPGAHVEYGPVGTELAVVYSSDGTYTPARGVRGGGAGACAEQRRRGRDGSLSDELGGYGEIVLAPGETIVSRCCGGGGYGPPHERDAEAVRKDVLEGWVSRERARDVYRVALDGRGEVDVAATARLRGG